MADLSFLAEDPVPAVVLTVGGILSVFIAAYGRREDTHLDEMATYLGFILGAFIGAVAIAVAMEGTVNWFTLTIISILALTLFLRPMKDIPWSGIVGLIAGAAAAYAASLYLPDEVFGVDRWIVLVVIFLVVGGVAYLLFHFLEAVLDIAKAVLNWAPVMIAVGLVAAAEGVLLLLDRSVLSFF